MRRLRRQGGQASVELLGLLPYLLLGALVMWQLLLATWAVTSASNAARAGSRVEARGGDGRAAAIDALNGPLRKDAAARISGERAEVRVRIPLLVPGVGTQSLTVTRSAVMPRTT
jgi:hypothetical protein